MKMGDAFPSKSLKAEDLGPNARVAVVVDRVNRETFGEGKDAETKPIVFFRGKDKGLVLNRTNFSAIVDISGKDDTDDWAGLRLTLYTTKVDYKGDRVLAIRVDEPPKGASRQAPLPPPPEPEPGADFGAEDSDVPF